MENICNDLNALILADQRTARRWLDCYASLLMTSAMIFGDVLGLCTAGAAAVLLRRLLLGPFSLDFYLWIAPICVLLVLLFIMRRLYPAIGLGAVEEFRSLTISISLMFIVVSTLTLALRQGASISRFVYGLLWLFSLITIPAYRVIVRHLMTRLGLWGEPVVVIGPLEQARRLAEHFHKSPKIGLRPVAIFTPADNGQCDSAETPVYSVDRLLEYRQQNHLRMALVLYDDPRQVQTLCEQYRDTFERVSLFSSRSDNFHLNKMTVQQYGGLMSLEVRHTLLDPWAQALKRIIDIFGSGIAILLLSPFFLVVAALIYLDSPGRIFYRQKRLGKNGSPFTLVKFRTMHLNADKVLHSYLEKYPALRQEWDMYQKLQKDPRITRVGHLLRRFSIDELAQLWNVFIGEMSLVGPRPIMLNQQEIYGKNLRHYVRVLPGITGLWQISGRNQTSFARRTEFDVEYVMSWSVWLDIYILIRTVWVVLSRDGAC